MIKQMQQIGKARRSPRATIPDGERVYAIGDIHGMRGALDRLLALIADDVSGFDGTTSLIFLGDYVDRGPDSNAVIDRLTSGDLPCDRGIFLKGNHEDVMLQVMDGREDREMGWLAFGGIETLDSYGIDRAAIRKAGRGIGSALLAVIPEGHRQFLQSLQMEARIGDYLFVHAGIRPGVPLDEQVDRDRMWIRETFLHSDADHRVVVVHGHSVTAAPVVRANRIGIDTGCFASGKLTALCLEGSDRRFLST